MCDITLTPDPKSKNKKINGKENRNEKWKINKVYCLQLWQCSLASHRSVILRKSVSYTDYENSLAYYLLEWLRLL